MSQRPHKVRAHLQPEVLQQLPEVFSIDLHSKSEVWFSLNLWQTRCVQLDGREVEAKRAVSREESNKPGIHKSVKRLFMGGVKENITEPDVKAYFSS